MNFREEVRKIRKTDIEITEEERVIEECLKSILEYLRKKSSANKISFICSVAKKSRIMYVKDVDENKKVYEKHFSSTDDAIIILILLEEKLASEGYRRITIHSAFDNGLFYVDI